jgi:hypothetical protein
MRFVLCPHGDETACNLRERRRKAQAVFRAELRVADSHVLPFQCFTRFRVCFRMSSVAGSGGCVWR